MGGELFVDLISSVKIYVYQSHAKFLYFFLAHTQAEVKYKIFMGIPIGLRFEGSHPIEWVIRIDNNPYIQTYPDLSQFEKSQVGPLVNRVYSIPSGSLCMAHIRNSSSILF